MRKINILDITFLMDFCCCWDLRKKRKRGTLYADVVIVTVLNRKRKQFVGF